MRPPGWRTLLTSLLGTAVAAVVLAGCAWGLYDRQAAEKLLVDLVMPLGLLWLALLALTIYAFGERNWPVSLISALAWGGCGLSGSEWTAQYLIRQLESPYFDLRPLESAPLDTIVVLGGGATEGPDGRPQANEHGDRLVVAARLYHAGRVERIVCTGTRSESISILSKDEGDLSRQLLLELGVPAERVTTLEGRNTFEEIAQLGRRAQEDSSSRRMGLITSAWHMRRAMRLAREHGLDIVALPSDYLSTAAADSVPGGQFVRNCIPRHSSLGKTSRALRELLAELIYR